MSDVQTENPVTPAAPAQAPSPEKRQLAEKVIGEILRLMGVEARLELKDAADGGISVALFPEGELPGAQPGKRSHLIDALQFLSNKIVNRPGAERRWISLGVGGHPEPRPPRAERPPQEAVSPTAGQPPAPPAALRPKLLPPSMRPPRPPVPPAAQPARRPNGLPPPAPVARAAEELTVEVPEDADITRLARTLFDRSSRLGRYYGVLAMKTEDRARMVKAVSGLSGATVKLEGEGKSRRVVFVPEKPAPMPSKAPLPDDDDPGDPQIES